MKRTNAREKGRKRSAKEKRESRELKRRIAREKEKTKNTRNIIGELKDWRAQDLEMHKTRRDMPL